MTCLLQVASAKHQRQMQTEDGSFSIHFSPNFAHRGLVRAAVSSTAMRKRHRLPLLVHIFFDGISQISY
jgi:hypothetical protein